MKKAEEAIIEKHLSTSGLKRTQGRVAVLGVLLSAHRPLTIEEIERKVRGGVHTVTLYRMLRQFVEEGIVYQTDLRTGKAYYELQQEHHHHIVCTDCGTQEEVRACVARLQKDAEKGAKKFRTINSHSLEFFGTCNKCARA